MQPPSKSPRISVVIPTFNRSALLKQALQSLAAQRIPRSDYEVIVVDDGSKDDTFSVCRGFRPQLDVRYFRIENSGTSSAKNLGIFASIGKVLLFFDDDDVADPELLREHIEAHEAHPQENVAILGYTDWASSLPVSPVMDYVLNIGQLLFAYRSLKDGQALDSNFFWCGRTSCKRSLLVRHGIFNPDFRAMEDVELGYRLSKFGLSVRFHRRCVSHMIRPLSYEEFCRRCERMGEALYRLSRLHPDPEIQQYCRDQLPPLDGVPYVDIVGDDTKWRQVAEGLARRAAEVHRLEARAAAEGLQDWGSPPLSELRELYRWTFAASKLSGLREAMRSATVEPPPRGRWAVQRPVAVPS